MGAFQSILQSLQEARIYGEEVSLVKSHVTGDNIQVDLWQGDGLRIVMMTDLDSGRVVTISKFPERIADQAEYYFQKCIRESQDLTERLFEKVGPATVYINPTTDELWRCTRRGRARGIVEGPNIFLWKEDEATHGYVKGKLALDVDIPFYIEELMGDFVISPAEFSGGSESDMPDLERHPKLQRMVGRRQVLSMAYN